MTTITNQLQALNAQWLAWSGKMTQIHYDFKDALAIANALHADNLAKDAEITRLKDALLDMVWQFCSHDEKLSHSFMSAEEYAFDVLNLENGMTYEEAEAAALAQPKTEPDAGGKL